MGKSAKPDEQQVNTVKEALELEDPIWAELSGEVARVLDSTNKAYGNSTEKSARILGLLYPDGIQPERLHDVRCMISILDKLSRIATDKDAFSESPWRDIAGYALLAYRHDLTEHEGRER